MAPRWSPVDVLAQAKNVLSACQHIDSNMLAGSVDLPTFADTLTEAQSIQNQIISLELQLTALRNRRDDRLASIWDMIKRFRFTVKGRFGDDSSEYELVGGTRISERKRSVRKPKDEAGSNS